MSDGSKWFDGWQQRAENVERDEIADRENLAIAFHETLSLFESLIDSLDAANPELHEKLSLCQSLDKARIPELREKVRALKGVCEAAFSRLATEKAVNAISKEFND